LGQRVIVLALGGPNSDKYVSNVSGDHCVGGCHVSILATPCPLTFSSVLAQVACAHNTVTLLDEFLFEHGVTSSRGRLLQEMQEVANIANLQAE
jgi:hypothetical protein